MRESGVASLAEYASIGVLMDLLSLSEGDPLRPAAESFLGRLHRGDRPTLAEYTERFPQHANRIRELFPKILAEVRRASDHGATGPYGPVESQPHVPKSIGDFQIVREIGRGGMGIVYEAMQESLDRQVALKVLPAGPFSRGPYLERFYREARAAGRLHHTNIVPVFGVGQAGPVHYYAMQYIEGMGLDAVIKEIRQRRGLPAISHSSDTHAINRQTRDQGDSSSVVDFELGPSSILPDVEAEGSQSHTANKTLADLAMASGAPYYHSVARLGVQVAEALAYAHDQGVLHRDVKPSNLLLDQHGILWITDFGLAKADGDDLSGPDDIVGTLRYMAPERFKGKSTAQSDVYALGMTLYELIALQPAFDDQDRYRLVERINRERPKRLHEIDPNVPCDLETIILKSIQRDGVHRYSSAAAMADDLRLYLTDRPISARPVSRLEELVRWCRRNPLIAILIAVVAALGFILAAVIFRAYMSIKAERDEVQAQKNRAVSAEIFNNDRLWTTQVTTARLRRSLRTVGQRFAALDALAEAGRIRQEAILAVDAVASLALPDIRRANGWMGWPDGTGSVHFDSAFERYARADSQGNISVRNVSGDSEVVQLPGGGGPAVPRFGYSGGFLAVRQNSTGSLVVWRLSTSGPTPAISERANVTDVDFGPGDNQVATSHLDGTITIYSLPSGRLVKSFRAGPTAVSVAHRPDGKELAVTLEREVAIFEVETGRQVIRFEVPGAPARTVWHPDGRHLAVATADGHTRIYRKPGLEPAIVLATPGEGPADVAFHPDGSMLVTAGTDRTVRLWCPFSGRLLLAYPGVLSQPRFNVDGRQFGPEIDGHRLQVLELASGRECRTFVPAFGESKVFHDGAVSRDSRLLAMGSTEGVVIWDMATSEELARLAVGDTVGCMFSSSGELLTSGTRGVYAWPVRLDAPTPTIGPPRQLGAWPCERIDRSADGSVVAVAAKIQGALILDQDRPTIRNTLLTHDAATFVSVNPDGKLIATGTQAGRNVRIWDVATNRLIRELETVAGSVAAFSPDGRWLATNRSGGGVQLWSTSDWTVKHSFESDRLSRVAFSPTHPLIAVESGAGSIRIYAIEPQQAGEQSKPVFAELEDPNHARAIWLSFSADGSRLIEANNDLHCVRVWDLATLQRGLGGYGISWPIAQLKPVTPVNALGHLQVIGGALLDPVPQARWSVVAATVAAFARPDSADTIVRRGVALAELGFDQLAMSDYGAALRQKPDHAEASYLRASEYFRLRQWEPALEDFTRAINKPAIGDSARWMRGKTLLQLDRVEEMMTDVNGLLQHYPDDPQLYYQRALGHAYRQRYSAAIEDLKTALHKGPSHDQALNNLAWIQVTGPAESRDPENALKLVERAVRSAPNKSTYQNTLGVCLYRLGRYPDALAALEKSQSGGRGQFDGYDFYVMAMCFAKQNELEKSRQYFARAEAWQKNTRLTRHEQFELQRFHDEAKALIGAAEGH